MGAEKVKSKKMGTEPAFPFEEVSERINGSEVNWRNHKGFSKRLLIAKDAASSLLIPQTKVCDDPDWITYIVQTSYKYADELLRQENL